MKAVFFLGDRKLEIRDVPDPTPRPGEVVLEIKASGICGTDITYYRAREGAGSIGFATKSEDPVIAGHEPCGVVCAVGPGVSTPLARVGRRVMNHHYAGCGSCRPCHSGWTQMCDAGATTFGVNGHGSHAQYMAVPADSLIALPDELSFPTGAAISCGTGTAWAALERLDLERTRRSRSLVKAPSGSARPNSPWRSAPASSRSTSMTAGCGEPRNSVPT